jgi:hypothetical protein
MPKALYGLPLTVPEPVVTLAMRFVRVLALPSGVR